MNNMKSMHQTMILACPSQKKKKFKGKDTHWHTPTAYKDPHIHLLDPTSVNTPLTVTDNAKFRQ